MLVLTFCMRRIKTFLKTWTKSMKRSSEWATKSLSPLRAFLMISWVSNMMNPQNTANPIQRWAYVTEQEHDTLDETYNYVVTTWKSRVDLKKMLRNPSQKRVDSPESRVPPR